MDSFLGTHTQRGITLEVLKDDLATYRKILQSALVQLIDREYADFVHLSSSLVRLHLCGQLTELVYSLVLELSTVTSMWLTCHDLRAGGTR